MAKANESKEEAEVKKNIKDFMAEEVGFLDASKIKTDALKLKHWNDITINKDINGKALLLGN